ncbi:lipopolysaccharide transport periplasmic protein LptA [Thalassomonas actiniarum]|uniref:Lipopolysaccharide export system protein LptA n=2 Tax=Thalassomonas actiniarum TaxID=485447 RepID=A0AAF0C245_9GAMM|nr:lipopolysaccharide transport periplasmic protein LptA [Thalassomonas actiniarum]
MSRPFMKNLAASLLLITSVIAVPGVNAAKADFEQRIKIDSDRQAADLKNKIASYLDNVRITQGSLVINADIVQVFGEKDSDVKTYLAKGNPATFEQLLDDGNMINLQADEIKYEPGKNMITISGHALLRQQDSQVSGSRITYNTLTEQLSAESDKNERVTTILEPESKDKDKN